MKTIGALKSITRAARESAFALYDGGDVEAWVEDRAGDRDWSFDSSVEAWIEELGLDRGRLVDYALAAEARAARRLAARRKA